eukprot:TRINITY_DN19020_c0_g1_i2.p1 TRINITY_DN19020_c0_g1~~TRINITY_DN19020_c0_g1_i2.p1  ORF type:complete len:343 (+),score=53.90 TRINITY_DN19020_c0_g1_i2:36-1064(+)
MGASSSSQSTNLHQFESDQTPLATIGIVEEYIYNRLLVECGPWNSWHRHFRLVCKEWSELKLSDEHYHQAFLNRFPVSTCAAIERSVGQHFDPSITLDDAITRTWRPGAGTADRPHPQSWRELLHAIAVEGADCAHPAGRDTAIERQYTWSQRLWTGRKLHGVLTGLDGAGKSTLGYHLCPDAEQNYMGCIGWNYMENYTLGNLSLDTWDCGGQEKVRPLWRHFFHGSEVLIYVVDSTDHERIDLAAMELHWLLNEPAHLQAGKFPVLVLGNKQDLPGALSYEQLWDRLGLSAFDAGFSPPGLGEYQVHLHLCSAIDKGIEAAGFQWLQKQLPDWKCKSNYL